MRVVAMRDGTRRVGTMRAWMRRVRPVSGLPGRQAAVSASTAAHASARCEASAGSADEAGPGADAVESAGAAEELGRGGLCAAGAEVVDSVRVMVSGPDAEKPNTVFSRSGGVRPPAGPPTVGARSGTAPSAAVPGPMSPISSASWWTRMPCRKAVSPITEVVVPYTERRLPPSRTTSTERRPVRASLVSAAARRPAYGLRTATRGRSRVRANSPAGWSATSLPPSSVTTRSAMRAASLGSPVVVSTVPP
ncbi:hypothetical protein GA0115258_119085 [Streptomyces sp. LamerLS-31b]|nr:hypothetical protein GA0115258_119085 [Streptomyces sp. LamerLS-31b]